VAIDPKLVDALLVDYKKPEDIIGENGLLKQLTKALLERALHAELTEYIGYDKHDPAGYNSANSRNGATKKKLKGDLGEIELETPRDRNGSFEPEIVSKGQTRFTGFDDKIISMYSRGMTTREIEGHLKEMYGVDVPPLDFRTSFNNHRTRHQPPPEFSKTRVLQYPDNVGTNSQRNIPVLSS
jgi:putative transposase